MKEKIRVPVHQFCEGEDEGDTQVEEKLEEDEKMKVKR